MSGLKLDLPTLANLLRRSESDKAISDFFGEQITLMKREEYYGWLELKSQGVDVVFNEAPWVLPPEQVSDPRELYLIAFHFHRQGHEGYAEYNGELPSGVTLGDTEADVLRKMGDPITRDGGNAFPVLNRPVPYWFQYSFRGAVLRFQFDPDRRLEMATLQASGIKLG